MSAISEDTYKVSLNTINDIKETEDSITENLSCDELVQRYAEIQGISIEDAYNEVGALTEYEILKNIENKTIEKIKSRQVPMNRAQRRALKKKVGSKKYAEMVADGDIVDAVTDTAVKLNYIDLIQKLRKLNEEKENENGTAIIENN